MFLSGSLGENLFSCLSQFPGTACIPWFMASSIFKASNDQELLSHGISLLIPTLLPSSTVKYYVIIPGPLDNPGWSSYLQVSWWKLIQPVTLTLLSHATYLQALEIRMQTTLRGQDSAFQVKGIQVQFLVGELKSHVLWGNQPHVLRLEKLPCITTREALIPQWRPSVAKKQTNKQTNKQTYSFI